MKCLESLETHRTKEDIFSTSWIVGLKLSDLRHHKYCLLTKQSTLNSTEVGKLATFGEST